MGFDTVSSEAKHMKIMETEKDLSAILLFVEMVEAGNLSDAARRLGMSRANVSYRLIQLEQRLGHELLRRNTRHVQTTEMGQRLYAHGCVVRDELHAARESMAAANMGPYGRVRLSLPSGYGALVMAQWLCDFKRDYPGIALEVMFDNRVDDLLRDEVDLAVRVMATPPQNLVARPLGDIRYIACASAQWLRDHAAPTQLEDLARVPVLTSSATGRKVCVTGVCAEQTQQVWVEPTLMSENFLFLRDAVLAGLGVGLVPDYVVAREIGAGQVVSVLPEWQLDAFGRHLYLLYMPGRLRAKAMTLLIEDIVQRASVCAALGGAP